MLLESLYPPLVRFIVCSLMVDLAKEQSHIRQKLLKWSSKDN